MKTCCCYAEVEGQALEHHILIFAQKGCLGGAKLGALYHDAI